VEDRWADQDTNSYRLYLREYIQQRIVAPAQPTMPV
jgi:hypothetical protein